MCCEFTEALEHSTFGEKQVLKQEKRMFTGAFEVASLMMMLLLPIMPQCLTLAGAKYPSPKVKPSHAALLSGP